MASGVPVRIASRQIRWNEDAKQRRRSTFPFPAIAVRLRGLFATCRPRSRVDSARHRSRWRPTPVEA